MEHQPTSQLEASTSIEDTTVLVRLSGEIDPATVATIRAALNAVDDHVTGVVLDLSQVTFLDSSGIRELIRARNILSDSGITLVLRDPSRQAIRVLELAGLTKVFDLRR